MDMQKKKNCTLDLNSGTLIITVANANLNFNGHLHVFWGSSFIMVYYPPPPPLPVRDVVLGVPVVPLLLTLRPRGGGAAHVRHAATPQEGPSHHRRAGQRGFPGLALRRRHHQ